VGESTEDILGLLLAVLLLVERRLNSRLITLGRWEWKAPLGGAEGGGVIMPEPRYSS
jgi:hypothetical protein